MFNDSELKAENERLREQNKILTEIATLNSNEVARLQKNIKIANDAVEIHKDRVKRLREGFAKEREQNKLERKAFALMCDFFGSSIEEIIQNKMGNKVSSGYLWDYFVRKAEDYKE